MQIILCFNVIATACIMAYLYSSHENREKREALIYFEFSKWLNERTSYRVRVNELEFEIKTVQKRLEIHEDWILQSQKATTQIRNKRVLYNLKKVI